MWLSWERGVFGFVAYLLHALPTWWKKGKNPLPLWLQYPVEFVGDSFEPEVYWLITRSSLETGSVSGFAITLHSDYPLAHWWWENDRWYWSLCCRGASLLSEFGLVMNPVHSAGSIVWLVFWAFALFCLVVFFVEDFRCLNLFCTFFTYTGSWWHRSYRSIPKIHKSYVISVSKKTCKSLTPMSSWNPLFFFKGGQLFNKSCMSRVFASRQLMR